MKDQFPAWFDGPNGEKQIFNSADEVSAGWTTGAEKRPATKEPVSQTSTPTPTKSDIAELDAHGHPWSADLHSPTKSKTTAGLWRMKVGATRPDPAPGYPLDL